jgi:hypothetical protein
MLELRRLTAISIEGPVALAMPRSVASTLPVNPLPVHRCMHGATERRLLTALLRQNGFELEKMMMIRRRFRESDYHAFIVLVSLLVEWLGACSGKWCQQNKS